MLKKIKSIGILNLLIAFVSIAFLFWGVGVYITTYGDYVSSFNDESGILGNIVYVNDARSDYDYYMGLNYTYSDDGKLPTSVNKNIYNDSNLVEVATTYSGVSLNGLLHGYVSLAERQDTYIYYKVYPVYDNGSESLDDDYILIELIDNPFTDRPIDKGFNGWVTSYLGASISFDSDYYTRYAKVPVTYSNNKPNLIEITFNASWVDANVSLLNSNWSSAFNNLYDGGIRSLMTTEYVYAPYDMTGYYYQVILNRGDSCSGYYNSNNQYQNNCTCRPGGFWGGTCTYYDKIDGEYYDENNTYYQYNRGFSVVDPSTLDFEIIEENAIYNSDDNMSSYYTLELVPQGSNLVGYYNANGDAVESCSSSSGCYLYKLLQYYNDVGDEQLFDSNLDYYYLVTRDTNIVVMNQDIDTTWGSAQDKPFTLTSIYNGNDYTASASWTVRTSGWFPTGVAVTCYNDTVIENIEINYGSSFTSIIRNPGSGRSSAGYFYGNYKNVKLGRGIIKNGSNGNFGVVIGGYNNGTGSSGAVTKYKLMVETGFYNALSLTNGTVGTDYTDYIEARGVYGNDYDRVNNNNDNLDIYYCASGSWGGIYYASSNIGIGFDLVVKSGKFGSSLYDYSSGIYVGGRYGGTHYSARAVNVQGGYIYNLIGGPLSASNRALYNDSYIYMTGGEVDTIIGGAGQSATYGNRIIQVTGGVVNHSVFGGSNGVDGSEGDGTVNGSSYIYIGGLATIGSTSNMNNNSTYYGAESGSVFGIGNGRENYSTIGSSDNSIIIIDGEAIINRNVYSGGNYGAVGISSTSSTTYSIINVAGGLIKGSIYGGGNNNGSGSTDKAATVTINMTGGRVNGSIYGGSNQLGTIYGDVNVNVLGGTIDNSVYGGGQGGYVSSDSVGTFVSGNVNVVIGDDSVETTPVIYQNVYGGSALGSVGGYENSTEVSSYNTMVTVNKALIDGSVFGGGQGDTSFTPYVMGNVDVIINGGDINNVFGGNDAAGMPNGYVKVYLNGGNVNNTYGGGNQTGVTTTNVYLQGGYSTNIFGGSNISGDVTTSNIHTTSGSATTIYGGNNQGGVTTTSNIVVDGASIDTIYGGGKLATTANTYINLNAATVVNVYGGGEAADITNNTNIKLKGSTVSNIYGGSNISGNVPISNIHTTSGSATTIYGGNNQGGVTTTSNIVVDGANIGTIYGGGDRANTTTSNVSINKTQNEIANVFGGGNAASVVDSNVIVKAGMIGNIYGGSNMSGDVTNSNIDILKENITNDSSVSANVTWVAADTESWQSTTYPTIAQVTVTLSNNTESSLDVWDLVMNIPNSSIYSNYSNSDIVSQNGIYLVNQVNRYYGVNQIASGGSYSFNFEVLSMSSKEDFDISYVFTSGDYRYEKAQSITITNVYGGNNQGGKTTNVDINSTAGTITNVYGGGNEAITGLSKVYLEDVVIKNEVYGGGNQAALEGSTNVDIINSSIKGNVFGGGNAGSVGGNTDLYVSDSNVLGSVYAGGNGVTAVVVGNTLLNVDGTTTVSRHVFGGGNAAATGIESVNNSASVVNIAGATILGNVYGGANTSVLYGTTNLNIGYETIGNTSLKKNNIVIKGTVFGGGEANASGSENYDYSFISVTRGITININGLGHTTFDLSGSIFGSGNASSTTGYSYINIDNYGTDTDYKNNISIQRANIVTISNSHIELAGATDRTNEYSTTLFTLSRIDHLKLKNNSTLYLQTGANLLKNYSSLVDINGSEVVASVIIDAEGGTINKNVNNKIYMYEGKNLNIATNESVTSYGDVIGMTFFGMYNHDRDGRVETALYNTDYASGDTINSSELYYFSNGSYVLGRHKSNHDYYVDGFYSVFENEESTNTVLVDYIVPTPEESNYYMWVIGEEIASYDISLSASKYSTLGTYELQLLNFSSPNTVFSIVGFNFNELNSDIQLVAEADIPRIADTSTNADTVMSLAMKTGNYGWITRGSTNFITDSENPILGTTEYLSENSSDVPSLIFYLYHSKNLSTAGAMGRVTISLLAITPIDDLTNDIERININVDLSRALYNTNDYEAAITAGREYKMFATSVVDITAKSSFSAYYSLYAESETPFYQEGYHRALVSTYVFPEKTKITMIDFANENEPEYYYYVVSSADVITAQNEFNIYGEASYNLSRFVRMGSSSPSNNYDDEAANDLYYNDTNKVAEEEFIFIVDFSESGITSDVTDKSLLLELRNSTNHTLVTVLGLQHSMMMYDVYYNKDGVIDVTADLSSNNLYVGHSIKLNVITNFVQDKVYSNTIYDTSYFDKKLGIKLSIIDEHGIQVNGADLLGVTFTYNGVTYHPRLDGTVRFNLAERVANVSSSIVIDTKNSNLASGLYTIKIESFASADGIYYGLIASDYTTLNLNVVDTIYGLKADMDEHLLVVDKDTGFTLYNNNAIVLNFEYSSGLANPNIRLSLYRRDYSAIFTNVYNLVDIKDYITNNYASTDKEFEYLMVNNPTTSFNTYLYLKPDLVTGTYKLTFSLYDGDVYVGDIYKYIVIK